MSPMFGMTRLRVRPSLTALACLALVVCFAFAHPASAEDLRDEAKAHFELGRVLYLRGKYRGALDEFKKSYDAAPVPGLLYNIGLCAEQVGDLETAIRSYRQYQAAHLEENDGHPDLEAHVAELEQRRRAPPPIEDATVALLTAPPGHKKPLYKEWWLWTTVAVAVVAGTTVGTVLGLRATTAPHLTFPAVTPQ
jgi:tetratricopeptide (TPR) repeat protein